MKLKLLALLPGLFLLAACGGEPPAPPSNAVTPSLRDPRTCIQEAPATFRVKFETTKGPFTVEAVREWSPRGVDRLWNMVKVGYFVKTPCYRVKRGFVAQFGFHPDPEINDLWRNAFFGDDAAGMQRNRRGMLTFGQMGAPNSRSIHLFVNFVDNFHLDSGFPPVARVVDGMNVIDSLYAGYGEAPVQGAIERFGQKYLDDTFPEVDYITGAQIIE